MNENIKNAIKFIALYIIQAGALWGLLDGYTYFKGSALKDFLGPYWVLIYIIPLFTSAHMILRKGKSENIMGGNISTQGNFSPGKVTGNYAVRTQPENMDQTNPIDITHEASQSDISIDKPTKFIETKGDYSPGEVGGDYTVEG